MTSQTPVNVGHDAEISIRQLMEKLQELTGIRRPIFYNTAKPEGYRRRAADATKLRQVTGFLPQISLEQGLMEMIDWYRSAGQQ